MTTYMLTKLMKKDYMKLNWTTVQLNCEVCSVNTEQEK